RYIGLLIMLAVLIAAGCGGGASGASGGGDGPANGAAGPSTTGGATGAATGDSSANVSIRWDYYLFVGWTHPIGEYAMRFADAVRERTGGRLEITVRPAGELPYGAAEMVRAVGEGRVQLGDGLATFITGEARVAAVPALPFLVTEVDELEAIWPTLKLHVDQAFADYGAQTLFIYTWPTQNVWGRGEPIRTLADFRGRKIRQTSPEHGALIARLGGEPVTFTTAEVPTALQRGVMNAVLSAAFNIRGAKWYEFLEWGYILDFGLVPSYILVNREAYAGLPDDVRAALDEVAAEFQAEMLAGIPARELDDRQALATEHGIELIEAADADRRAAVELMASYWDEWAREGGPETVEALAAVRAILGK
ncbi:MAG TPA: TRAP transporter substrate-binding protein DctP, partial [Bacillota bacterium]